MSRRLIILAVVGFWLVMTGTLVRRWIRERRLEHAPGTYRSMLTRERRNAQQRMGIYWRGQRVGYTQTTFLYQKDGRHHIHNVTEIRAAVPGLWDREAAFRLDTTVLVGSDLSLEGLSLRLDAEGFDASCHGTVSDGTLTLRPVLNGRPQEPIQVEMPPGAVVGQGLSPLQALPPLSTGMRWSMTVVDPFSLMPSEVDVRVLRREEIVWQGRREVTHVVEVRSGLWMRALAWVSREGEVLKQSLLGLTFLREPVEEEGQATRRDRPRSPDAGPPAS